MLRIHNEIIYDRLSSSMKFSGEKFPVSLVRAVIRSQEPVILCGCWECELGYLTCSQQTKVSNSGCFICDSPGHLIVIL